MPYLNVWYTLTASFWYEICLTYLKNKKLSQFCKKLLIYGYIFLFSLHTLRYVSVPPQSTRTIFSHTQCVVRRKFLQSTINKSICNNVLTYCIARKTFERTDSQSIYFNGTLNCSYQLKKCFIHPTEFVNNRDIFQLELAHLCITLDELHTQRNKNNNAI